MNNSNRDRIKIDNDKVNPIHKINIGRAKAFSSLAPQHVPSEMEVFQEGDYVILNLLYETNTSEESVLLDLDFLDEPIVLKEINIYIGKLSKRLVRIEIPVVVVNYMRNCGFDSVQKTLNEVREKHPRWGSFSAGANIFQQYGASIDKRFTQVIR